MTAIDRALTKIDARHAEAVRLAEIESAARIAEFIRQFSQDRTGLLTWLGLARRSTPRPYADIETAEAQIKAALGMEKNFAAMGDWKSRPELIPALHERLEVARHFAVAESRRAA